MTHRIALVGGYGNMGKRYACILKFLKIEHYIIDLTTEKTILPGTTGLLICTPTNTHYSVLKEYSRFELPILCEKPITKDPEELEKILQLPVNIRMMNQYEYFFRKKDDVKKIEITDKPKPNTYYNYYNTGQDGIRWDCINIIGLGLVHESKSIKVGNDSPIWECWIASKKIHRNEIDDSYIWNLEDWINKYDDNKQYITLIHKYLFERDKIK